jgi:hypothetical protein
MGLCALLTCPPSRCQVSSRKGVDGGGKGSFGGALARWRGWLCARAPGLTSVRDPGWLRVGDMMFDGVIPLGEALRPLDLSRPSTVRWRQQGFGSRPRRICVSEGLTRTGEGQVGRSA